MRQQDLAAYRTGHRGLEFLPEQALNVFLRRMGPLRTGRLSVISPSGRRFTMKGTDGSETPHAVIRVADWRCLPRLMFGGQLGFAESYLRGEWDTPDLLEVFGTVLANGHEFQARFGGSRVSRTANMLAHRLRANSRRGSRRNIAYHYDLGNDFYAAWLDPSMTYSSALFEHPGQDLQQAQAAKYRAIAEAADLRDGQDVLEIGCGWGGFAELAARDYGSRLFGVTLSRGQLAYARARLETAGLQDRAELAYRDYRDLEGQYDRIVSIEMFEAVGEENWPRFFDIVHRRLKPGGIAAMQVISVADDRFEAYRKSADFIQRYIFPGGMLPSPSAFRSAARAAGLEVDREQFFGQSYADTLANWRQHFAAAWPQLATQGFDERFRRMWTYYLSVCEASFRAGTIDVGIYHLRRPA